MLATQDLINAQDRAIGCLLGLAVGDAVGTTLEFVPRHRVRPIDDMVGGGPFSLAAGEWTDDTAMALALADSLMHEPTLDAADLMARFTAWYMKGEYSCTGTCFDIGITTRSAIHAWQASGNPFAGPTVPRSAGNGSLMRLAPVAVRHWHDADLLADVAARQSRTTHGAPEAVGACVLFARILSAIIGGGTLDAAVAQVPDDHDGRLRDVRRGDWKAKSRDQIGSSGYVMHSLEAALWCADRTTTFRDAILLAANLGEDADTTAAITGQLCGALYGATAIPAEWLAKLAWRDRIEARARALFSATTS